MVLVVASWLILLLLVETPDSAFHSVVTVGACLILFGLEVGIFFMVWFGQMVILFRPKWLSFMNMAGNIAFTTGAILSLGLKFSLADKDWMIVMMVFLAIGVISPVLFIFFFYDEVILQPEEHQLLLGNDEPVRTISSSSSSTEPEKEMTGLSLLSDLILWKRQWSGKRLMKDPNCDVSSRQFYLILACYTSMQILAITFMSNLGPLTGESAGDDDSITVNERSQLIILIWSVAGQTFGRMILPVITDLSRQFFTKSLSSSSSSSQVQGYPSKSKELVESKIRNRTTLPFVLLIGIIFLSGSVILKFFNGSFDFIYASTAISVGYGMNWVSTTLLVFFFPTQFAFTVFLSFFQVFSSIATLIMICIVSFLQFDKETIFATLLVLSCVTSGFAILAILDRFSTEVVEIDDLMVDSTDVQSPLLE
jgi:hypothetical protein